MREDKIKLIGKDFWIFKIFFSELKKKKTTTKDNYYNQSDMIF